MTARQVKTIQVLASGCSSTVVLCSFHEARDGPAAAPVQRAAVRRSGAGGLPQGGLSWSVAEVTLAGGEPRDGAADDDNNGDDAGSGRGGAPRLMVVKRYLDRIKGRSLLYREVSILSAVQPHPNVVRLGGTFLSASGCPHLALEYVPRCVATELSVRRTFSAAAGGGFEGAVSGVIRGGGGGLSALELKLLAWQLARALQHLHRNQVAHCDIRPANLLIDDADVLKLCGFDAARFLQPCLGSGRPAAADALLFPGPGPGLTHGRRTDPRDRETPWYLAPEVLSGGQGGAPADVWSYGCTVAELAAGRPLLPGSSEPDQFYRIMRLCGLPPYDPHAFLHDHLSRGGGGHHGGGGAVSPPLIHLLESCLRLDPNDRATADQLLRMPYFSDVYDIIAGTELQRVYDACGMYDIRPLVSPPPHSHHQQPRWRQRQAADRGVLRGGPGTGGGDGGGGGGGRRFSGTLAPASAAVAVVGPDDPLQLLAFELASEEGASAWDTPPPQPPVPVPVDMRRQALQLGQQARLGCCPNTPSSPADDDTAFAWASSGAALRPPAGGGGCGGPDGGCGGGRRCGRSSTERDTGTAARRRAAVAGPGDDEKKGADDSCNFGRCGKLCGLGAAGVINASAADMENGDGCGCGAGSAHALKAATIISAGTAAVCPSAATSDRTGRKYRYENGDDGAARGACALAASAAARWWPFWRRRSVAGKTRSRRSRSSGP